MILVRLFPKLLGTSRRYYSNYASNNNKSKQSRGDNRPVGTSVISNVERSQHDRAESRGITCQKTYVVEYGDNDETELVHMRELDYKSSKSDVSV